MAEPELTYPSHPFSPQLCTEIAALPLGLSDIALDEKISEQVITLLCRLAKMAQETPLTKRATTEEIYNVSVNVMNYMTRGSVSTLERCICLFAFIFMLRVLPDRNETQKFYGQFLVNIRRKIKMLSKTFLTLDGASSDLAIWGVAMVAIENSPERIGLDENERSELFRQLLQMHRQAANWKQTWKCLKRFFFLDSWMDEYRIWWNKEIEQNKRRPRETQ